VSYTVAFAPEALAQLDALEDYISKTESPVVAARFVDNIINYCDSLSVFPLRGKCRNDLLPGVRITHYRHTTAIAFSVAAETETVSILGVFYGGQDYAVRFENADLQHD
jgi:plasmid stabilization system protein ParE